MKAKELIEHATSEKAAKRYALVGSKSEKIKRLKKAIDRADKNNDADTVDKLKDQLAKLTESNLDNREIWAAFKSFFVRKPESFSSLKNQAKDFADFAPYQQEVLRKLYFDMPGCPWTKRFTIQDDFEHEVPGCFMVELKGDYILVVDTEGYNYARYAFIITDRKHQLDPDAIDAEEEVPYDGSEDLGLGSERLDEPGV